MAFTTLPTLPALYVPTAAEFAAILAAIAELRPIVKIKSGNQSVPNTTLVNDSELFASLAASATYRVDVLLAVTGSTAGDLKVAWTVPSGASGTRFCLGPASSSTARSDTTMAVAALSLTASTAYGTSSASAAVSVRETLTVQTSSAGTLTMQFAQQTADATATTVQAGSVLIATRMS